MSNSLTAHLSGKRAKLRTATRGAPDNPQLDSFLRPASTADGSISIIAGTRPEIIKLAPVYHALRAGPLPVSFTFTGQHGEMALRALKTFEIAPDDSFQATASGTSLSQIQSVILQNLDERFAAHPPALVLVQGDTTTALCGAMAAFNARLPVGHVEAGLSTGNKYNPFPEEMNRTLIAQMASVHFAPTEQAQQNLLRMGIAAESILVTGNTVVDAVSAVTSTGFDALPALDALRKEAPMVLVTTHRREAWGAGLDAICSAVQALAERCPGAEILWPVHGNPVVREPVTKRMSGLCNVHLLEPLDYPAFLGLMAKAALVLTDSGGVQEEAPSLGVTCLVLRENTERPEAVDSGLAWIVGHDPQVIVRESLRILQAHGKSATISEARNPFGDGLAGARIAAWIERAFDAEAKATG